MMAWFPGIGWFRCFSFAVAKTEEELNAWLSVVVVFGISKSAFSTNRRRALRTGETPLRMTFRGLLNRIESNRMNHAVSNRGRSKNPGSRLNLLVNFSYHF